MTQGERVATGGAISKRLAIRDAMATPEAIYGTILFLAMLSVSEDGQRSSELFFHGIVASVSIWAAHVIAVAVASHGSRGEQVVGVRESFRRALDHSYGILVGPLLPSLALLLGTLDVLTDDDSYMLALCSSALILAALGYLAMSERRARWYVCLLSAVVTMVAGLAAALLKGTFS